MWKIRDEHTFRILLFCHNLLSFFDEGMNNTSTSSSVIGIILKCGNLSGNESFKN
jgi:hypothetical protein